MTEQWTEEKLKQEVKFILKQIPRDIYKYLNNPNDAPSYSNYIDQIHGLYKKHTYLKGNEELLLVLDFAERVARVMDNLRSSHVFFILQQAYEDMEWTEAQSVLDDVIKSTKEWKK